MEYGAPGIIFGIEIPGANGPHPGKFFGDLVRLGIDPGVLKDLTVVDLV